MANRNYEDEYLNANFANQINEQMRVPKRIKATGEYYEEHDVLSQNNGYLPWNYHEKIEMNVPDRIVVGPGQDEHLVIGSGTKSAPREMLLENALMPKEPGFIRVSTPPRVITMNHYFPSASDDPEDEDEPKSIESINNDVNNRDIQRQQHGKFRPTGFNTSDMMTRREQTPTFSSSIENLAPSDEVLHLRRQVAKLNRRVLAIELDSLQQQQKEKIICCLGLAYFMIKAVVWLNKK